MSHAITIIIVNFNTRELLDKCLHSISISSKNLSTQVVVVDNLSNDDSVKMISQKYPWVQLIANSSNAGFAKANNQGLKEAEGKYTFFLNPDTEIAPNCLSLLGSFLENSNAGAAGPKTFLDSNHKLEVCSLKILTPDRARAFFTRFNMQNRGDIYDAVWEIDFNVWKATAPIQVEGIGGAAFFTHTDLLKKIGGMDERFFMGYEDSDLAAIFQKLNIPIFFVPQASIVHLFGQSKNLPSAPRQSVYSFQKGPVQFLRKHYGIGSNLKFQIIKTADSLFRKLSAVLQETIQVHPTHTDLHIRWKEQNGPFLFEISNDRPFFDKFGLIIDTPFVDLPARLLFRLLHGKWFYRIFKLPLIKPYTPFQTGIIQIKHES